MTSEEDNHWLAAQQTFFEPPPPPKACGGRRPALSKPSNIPDRLATLAMTRSLNHAFYQATLSPLDDYSVPWEELQVAVAAPDFSVEMLLSIAAPVTANCDQGPLNVAANQFIMHKTDIPWMCFWDPVAHRSNNDANIAVNDAGIASAPYVTAPLFNYKRGPLGKGEWRHMMKQIVKEAVAHVSPNSAVLMQFWPRICSERGWVLDSETDETARQEFLNNLVAEFLEEDDSEHVAASRWYSCQHRSIREVPVWSTHGFLFTFYCLRWGIVSRAWKVFKTYASLFPALAAEPPPPDAHDDAIVDGSGATASDAIVSHSEGLTNKYSKAKNTLHVNMMLTNDYDLFRKVSILAHGLQPLATECGKDIKAMAKPDTVKEKYIGYTTQAWLEPLHMMSDQLTDAECLRKCGFIISLPHGSSWLAV